MPSLAEYFAYAALTFGILGAVFACLAFVAVLADDFSKRRTCWHTLADLYLFLWLIVYPIGCSISWFVSI